MWNTEVSYADSFVMHLRRATPTCQKRREGVLTSSGAAQPSLGTLQSCLP